MKYLGLISSIALLHQYAREVKRVEHHGKTIEYVEVIPSDIALANKLASVVLGRSLDELPPQTRKLLIALHDWIGARSELEEMPIKNIKFRRKQARDELGWSDTPLKVHLGRLVEMEYLYLHRTSGLGGIHFEYQLAYEGTLLGSIGLSLPSIQTKATTDKTAGKTEATIMDKAVHDPPDIAITSKVV